MASDYWEGLGVVPIVMAAEVFMGIYFNLSFWYKLTDRTWWGAVMSATGAAVMIVLNVVLVPRIGYWACAWGGFAGYGVAMLMSYFIGRKYYPVSYDYKGILSSVLLAALLCLLYYLPQLLHITLPLWTSLLWATLLLALYCLPFALKFVKQYKHRNK